ncbi:hypothetical protein GW17_00026612 [Ensete ventricosum]|uniref:Uncharacterized protein n=1 Tax=Ensete ventricosum TaxID=4639 RepID=A0A444EHS3_ENSVE|nr:hypothetical protein GW17_00026612 [Ensete ventricosum]RZR71568.1 hypothetical protein BHM03_00005909 [Ensete ventricosum]
MPPQDRAPVKDADLESMSMNLKEGGHYVVNHDEDLMAVDFGDNVSLAEKEAVVLSTMEVDFGNNVSLAEKEATVRDDIVGEIIFNAIFYHAPARSSSCQGESMSMNLKEGGRYVVNCNEDLTAIDFRGNVSLAEKEAAMLSTAMVDFDDNVSLAKKEAAMLSTTVKI